jgi:hypothetical protein
MYSSLPFNVSYAEKLCIFDICTHAYRILVGKPEGRRPLEKSRCRWVDNIIIDLTEIEWDGMD